MLQILTTVWELELQKLGKGTAGLGHGVNKGTEVGKLLQNLNVFCTCVASLLFASPGSLAAVCSHQRKGLAILRMLRDNGGEEERSPGSHSNWLCDLGQVIFPPSGTWCLQLDDRMGRCHDFSGPFLLCYPGTLSQGEALSSVGEGEGGTPGVRSDIRAQAASLTARTLIGCLSTSALHPSLRAGNTDLPFAFAGLGSGQWLGSGGGGMGRHLEGAPEHAQQTQPSPCCLGESQI